MNFMNAHLPTPVQTQTKKIHYPNPKLSVWILKNYFLNEFLLNEQKFNVFSHKMR